MSGSYKTFVQSPTGFLLENSGVCVCVAKHSQHNNFSLKFRSYQHREDPDAECPVCPRWLWRRQQQETGMWWLSIVEPCLCAAAAAAVSLFPESDHQHVFSLSLTFFTRHLSSCGILMTRSPRVLCLQDWDTMAALPQSRNFISLTNKRKEYSERRILG